MAQTGFTPLSLYYSATTTNVPLAANLVAGELALNTADGKLFYKDSSNVVQVIGTKGGVGSSSTTQVLYNSSGLVVGSANMTFNGTVLTSSFAGPVAATTLSASSTVSGTGFSTYLASPPAIGGTAAAAGAFTTLSASSTVSGTGFSTYLASPPAIGGTAAAAGAFTTLTTSSTVTISGGTANGVAYLDGSKVLTTGSALTFDGSGGLNVSTAATNGSVSVIGPNSGSNSGAQFNITNGAAATSSIGNYSRVIGGAYNESLAFYNNGNDFVWYSTSERMRLTSSGLEVKQAQLIGYSSYAGLGSYGLAVAGNVGIGTAAPGGYLSGTAKLVVLANTNGQHSVLVRNDNAGSSASSAFALTASGNTWGIECGSSAKNSNALTFQLDYNGGNSTKMTLDAAGNLGLGVTPSAWNLFSSVLQLNGGASVAAFANTTYFMQNAAYISGFKYITTAAAGKYELSDTHKWFTAASGTAGNPITFTQAMTLDASGNLLVGPTSTYGTSKLSVNGDLTLANGNGYSWGSNSSSYTGFVGSNAANYIAAYTGGVARMTLDSSGNLGLGVTPSATWSSDIKALQNSGGSLYTYAGGNIGLAQNCIYNGANWVYLAATNASLYYQAGGSHIWGRSTSTPVIGNSTAFSDAMTLDASGNLGIGTTSPASNGGTFATFSLNGSNGGAQHFMSANATVMQLYNDANAFFINASSGKSTVFQTASAETMRINSSGNLGIGTASPTNKLEVASSTTNTGITIYNNYVSGGLNARLGFKSLNGYDGSSVLAAVTAVPNASGNTATSLVFSTSGDNSLASAGLTERMRLDSSGNLLVGATSAGGSKFRVNSAGLAGAFYVTAASTTATEAIQIVKFDNNSTTAQVFQKFYINDGAAACGQINANGANTAAFGSTSDSRLKENIVDLPSQLSNIMALRPVEFDYIESEGGGHQIGFVAQEIQAVYSDTVGERKDGMLMVTGWSKTEARLVKAIQEQQAMIEDLKTRLAAAGI